MPQRLYLLNEYRMLQISALKKERGSKMKIIIADMPLTPKKKQKMKYKYLGCVVKDLHTLPAPPYERKDIEGV